MAIVGGGVMGLAAAAALGRRGVRCAIVDPLPRRTERNASNDESKVFRLAYGDRADYTALAARSLEGWRSLERDARRTVLHRHGLLLLGHTRGSFADRTAAVFPRMGKEATRFDAGALAARFPAFAGGGFDHAVLDPDGGLLDPPAILESLEADAIAHRAKVFRDQRVVALEGRDGGLVCVGEDAYLGQVELRAEKVIVAAGYRAPLLLPELAPLLRTTRQPEFLFEPSDAGPYRAEKLPVFAAFEDGFYGFPLHRGAVKVADHRKGAEVPHDPPFEPPSAAEEATCRDLLRGGMPGLADARLARSRICFYDNTPDDDPLLGWHPQREGVLLCVGWSGHGFKFAPAAGEALAAMVLGEEPAKEWAAMDPKRLLA